MKQLYRTIGESLPDNLIAGSKWTIGTKGVTLAAGQGQLKRGTVLGIITDSGEAVAVDSAKSDGSQMPDCILADDTDTASGAVTAAAFSAGEFIRGSLIFGGTDIWQTHEQEMRRLNMHMSASVDEKGGVN